MNTQKIFELAELNCFIKYLNQSLNVALSNIEINLESANKHFIMKCNKNMFKC